MSEAGQSKRPAVLKQMKFGSNRGDLQNPRDRSPKLSAPVAGFRRTHLIRRGRGGFWRSRHRISVPTGFVDPIFDLFWLDAGVRVAGDDVPDGFLEGSDEGRVGLGVEHLVWLDGQADWAFAGQGRVDREGGKVRTDGA